MPFAPDSYSARSLADNVWARNRASLDIDLGANGANPLNNTPFIGKTRIDEITGVRNQAGWRAFIKCIEAAKNLSSREARLALRGFILARTRGLLPAIDIDPSAGDNLAQSALVAGIRDFVAMDSEGGRRAQACVAALLDAVFGVDHVCVGVINDPDRRAPLDVSVVNDTGQFIVAFEVKDKAIQDSHVRSSIEKTVNDHNVRNLGFVAVGRHQQQTEFDDVGQWAAQRGVKATIFLSWDALYLACKCFATVTDAVFEGIVYRRVVVRASSLGVSRPGTEYLKTLVD